MRREVDSSAEPDLGGWRTLKPPLPSAKERIDVSPQTGSSGDPFGPAQPRKRRGRELPLRPPLLNRNPDATAKSMAATMAVHMLNMRHPRRSRIAPMASRVAVMPDAAAHARDQQRQTDLLQHSVLLLFHPCDRRWSKNQHSPVSTSLPAKGGSPPLSHRIEEASRRGGIRTICC